MRILLDTNVLFWTARGELDKLSEKTLELLQNPANELYVSICSIWEIEMKHLKKPELMPVSGKEIYDSLINTNANILGIEFEYVNSLKTIFDEKIHGDPFDQIIMATALCEDLYLLSSDEMIAKYQNIRTMQC